MTIHLNTQDDLEAAIAALVKQDPRLKPVLDRAGMPALRRREPGFVGLAHIVCGQQLSTASASAIWERLSKAFDPFDQDAVRRSQIADALAVESCWPQTICARRSIRSTRMPCGARAPTGSGGSAC